MNICSRETTEARIEALMQLASVLNHRPLPPEAPDETDEFNIIVEIIKE